MSDIPDKGEWTMTGAIATNRTAPPIPFTSRWVRAEYGEWLEAEVARLKGELATAERRYAEYRAAAMDDVDRLREAERLLRLWSAHRSKSWPCSLEDDTDAFLARPTADRTDARPTHHPVECPCVRCRPEWHGASDNG